SDAVNTYRISNKGMQVLDNMNSDGAFLPKTSEIISVSSFSENDEDILITLSENMELSSIGVLSRESKEFMELPFNQNGHVVYIKKDNLLNEIDIHQSKWEFVVEASGEIESDVVYKKLKLENTF